MDRRYDSQEEFHTRPREQYRYFPDNKPGRPIVSLIGVLIMIVALLGLFFSLDYYFDEPQLLITLQHLLTSMFLRYWIYLPHITFLIYSIPLPFSGREFKVRLLDLKWTTKIAMKVVVRRDLGMSVINTLQSMSNLTWYTYVKNNPKEIIIILQKTRRFLPVTRSSLSLYLENILLTNEVTFTPCEVPKISIASFVYVSVENFFSDNLQITRNLEHSTGEFEFLTEVRFSKFHYDQYRHREEPEYKVRIAFRVENLVVLHPFFTSLGHRSRIHFRRLHQYFQQDRDLRILLVIINNVFLGIILRYSSAMSMGGKKAHRLMLLPHFGERRTIDQLRAPRIKTLNHGFGRYLDEGQVKGRFDLPVSDFAQGGLIAGAIGTGKTTLRLHIMKLLADNHIRIIDFDLKGDATKYPSIVQSGKIVVPNENFQLNPFECPAGYSRLEYADIILQSFVETIPHKEEISPAQLYLLNRSIQKTISENGNSRDFFENIMIIANQQREIVDNKQDTSALALITKFDWMQSTFRDIFWKDGSSVLYSEYKSRSLFFDLSKLAMVATTTQIQFLINLITAKIMATLREQPPSTFKQAIFIDEAQLLIPKMPDFQSLTKLEQTIATLRYKGVAVIAAGISANLMSGVLRDVGFVAQFRTESDTLVHTLNLTDLPQLLPELEDYSAVIKSRTTTNLPVVVEMDPFAEAQEIMKRDLSVLQDLGTYELDFVSSWKTRLDALFLPVLTLNGEHLEELKIYARSFENQQQWSYQFDEGKIHEMLNTAKREFVRMKGEEIIAPIALRYPKEFINLVFYHYLLQLIRHLRFDSKLNLLQRNLNRIIHETLGYIDDNTRDLRSTNVEERFADLKSLAKMIDTGEGMTSTEISAFIIKTIAAMEFLLRKILHTDKNMATLIQLAKTEKIITSREARILDQFRVRIRNPYVHGQYVGKKFGLGLVTETAKIILELANKEQEIIDDSAPLYEIG